MAYFKVTANNIKYFVLAADADAAVVRVEAITGAGTGNSVQDLTGQTLNFSLMGSGSSTWLIFGNNKTQYYGQANTNRLYISKFVAAFPGITYNLKKVDTSINNFSLTT